jgi:L-ascorbate oxidase
VPLLLGSSNRGLSEYIQWGGITRWWGATDGCLEAVLINGRLGGPLIEVDEGELLQVTARNNLDDPQYVDYFGSTTVHWHGFAQKGIPYLDGTAFVSQCPLERDQVQKIDFNVYEPPGTYFYHDHRSMLTEDGLAGGIIIRGSKDKEYDAEYNVTSDVLLLVSEWFDANSPTQSKGLNQPFPLDSNQTGAGYFAWVGNPRSLLMNFQGCVADCSPPEGNSTDQVCEPDPNCDTRYVMNVQPDSTVRVRLVGGGTLVYQKVCFENHEITLIEADARKVEPLILEDGCVDINLGQRMDVILKTKSPEELLKSNKTSFWISGRVVGGRTGMPASYGVLSYTTNGTEVPPIITLPTTEAPQPGDVGSDWSENNFAMEVKSPNGTIPEWVTSRVPANRTVFLEMTQPVLQQTTQIRWAMSNAVDLKTPSCKNVLEASQNNTFLTPSNPDVVETSSGVSNVDIYDMPGLGEPGFGSGKSYIFLNLASNLSLTPDEPVAGTPVVQTSSGEIVDIVMQDLPGGALGGIDLNRTNQEQHPMHLHGHHFYIIGSGPGVFEDLERDNALGKYLNWENPQLRDTGTLPKKGWLYIRYRSDNPGVWPLHCHIMAHEFMGMVLLLGENTDSLPTVPADTILPQCTEKCVYSAKIYNSSATDANPSPGTSPSDNNSAAGLSVALTAGLLPLLISAL